MKQDLESCKSLAEQLTSDEQTFTAMQIGKIRKAVCDEEDLDGSGIKPSGVMKIMSSLKKEMDIIETAAPEVVLVKVLHQQTGNKHMLFAMDMETRRKVKILIPFRQKNVLNTKGKRLRVERGLKDGTHLYRYPVRKG